MLINSPELVLGSWGLINADPSTGDPSETEMDTILILTKDSYFVADYDDQVELFYRVDCWGGFEREILFRWIELPNTKGFCWEM